MVLNSKQQTYKTGLVKYMYSLKLSELHGTNTVKIIHYNVYIFSETSTSGEYYNTSSIIRQNSPLAVKLTELSTHVKQGLANFNFLRQFEVSY